MRHGFACSAVRVPPVAQTQPLFAPETIIPETPVTPVAGAHVHWRLAHPQGPAGKVTKSRVPRAAPGMVCFQNLPAPPMSACSPGFPLPPCIPSILPQRYQVWRPALPRQAPWPSQRHAFWCSSIRPLEAIPSWGTWEVPPHKYDGDARQGGMPLCDLPVRCQLSLPHVSALASHTFSFLPCHDMALRDGSGPASLRAFPSLHRPTGNSFLKGGARGGRTFFQKGFPPRNVFPQIFVCFKSSGIRLPLCRVTFPLENDQETTTPVSLASDNVPPAGERQA